MVSHIYQSHSTSRGAADFKTIQFSNASIELNSAKASTASFNSIEKLNEGDRIRIVGDNHRPFGGQIIKPGSKLKDGNYSYDCIDYTRLFFVKFDTTWSDGPSYDIIKSMLNSLGYSTAGLEKTSTIHGQLNWKNVTCWDIIQQLRWLDYQGGQLIECYVNEDGTLIYRPLPQTHEGYIFKSAYDYSQEYDASNIIVGVIVETYKDNKYTVISNVGDAALAAIWGEIYEPVEGC
jgi:hypothetical protein